MFKCPVCEKTAQGPVCSECGFEESCYYECYPTLMRLQCLVPSVSERKARIVRQNRKITHCPHCGSPVGEVSIGDICDSCGLPVNPEDIVSLHCLLFDNCLHKADYYAQRRLLVLAENVMRYFEYIEEDHLSYAGVSIERSPREYAQIFQDIADLAHFKHKCTLSRRNIITRPHTRSSCAVSARSNANTARFSSTS